MKWLFILFALLATATTSIEAQRRVRGTVSDDQDQPLAGAAILVKGTTTGAITDVNGAFELTLPPDAAKLVVSYLGFISQELEIGSSNAIDVILIPDIIGLEDLVVIGYSAQRKKDITGSVASVAGEVFEDIPGIGVQNALQGRAAGVTVVKHSGTPGSGIDVRVRGSTSITASNQPLYVIDGVPVITGDFAQIYVGGQVTNALTSLNPNDIESIEVLKDAATASIYGNRAANGVVLITTKKGKAGQTSIQFDASYGLQKRMKKIEMMSAEQYRDQMELLYGDRDYLVGGLGGNTDWMDEVFRTSPVQDYNLSFNGGNEKTRFFVSLAHLNEQGILLGSGFKRYNARMNLDHVATKKFTFGMNMSYQNSTQQRIGNDNYIFGVMSNAILQPATVPIYNEDGSYAFAFGYENPIAAALLYDQTANTNRITGNVFGKYEILDGLFLKANLGLDALMFREESFFPSTTQYSVNGTVQVGESTDLRWLTEYTINYGKSFRKHRINALAGVGFQEDKTDYEFIRADNFPTDDFRALSAAASVAYFWGGFEGDALASYFGNVNYSFTDKYIVAATFRADGSSRFGNDKYGYFPGIAAAWRISSERFMAKSLFDELKLRLGWGRTGNNAIANFTALPLYGGGANYLDEPGIKPYQLGNPGLKWETTDQFSTGLDFAVQKSRLSGSLDFYVKKTKDLLLERAIPSTSGFLFVLENIGEVKNTGVELNLSAIPMRMKNFTWTVSTNLGYNKNKILKLYRGQPVDPLLFGGFGGTRLAEGHPIGSGFGWVTDGLFQNQAEIDAHASQPGAAPGDIRFKDISGGAGPDGILGTADDLPPDGVINDADRTFIGQGLPDFTGGFTNNFTWKGFTLDIFFQFVAGNEVYNNTKLFGEGMQSVFNTRKDAWEGRWQKEGDDEDYPRAVLDDPNNNLRISTRFYEDGSYLRLKTATLSYDFPTRLIGKAHIRKLRIFLSGQNLLTFTKYSWFDPEVAWGDFSTSLSRSWDAFTMPQPRSLVFGINLGL